MPSTRSGGHRYETAASGNPGPPTMAWRTAESFDFWCSSTSMACQARVGTDPGSGAALDPGRDAFGQVPAALIAPQPPQPPLPCQSSSGRAVSAASRATATACTWRRRWPEGVHGS